MRINVVLMAGTEDDLRNPTGVSLKKMERNRPEYQKGNKYTVLSEQHVVELTTENPNISGLIWRLVSSV